MRNGINQRSGIHVVIEDNTKNPSIVSKGISVMPGTETNIGLQRSTVLRLPPPFNSSCTNVYNHKRVEEVVGSDFQYSSKVCKGVCFSFLFYDACKCLYPSLLEGFAIETYFRFVKDQVRTCNVTLGSDDHKCIDEIGKETLTESKTCSCYPECTEIRYSVRYFPKNY